MCDDDPASTPMYFTIALHTDCADRHWYALKILRKVLSLFLAAFSSVQVYFGLSPIHVELL